MITQTPTHPKPEPTSGRRCTAISASGAHCQAWAVHGSDPPRCAPHGGGHGTVGAPAGNQNARTHGFYTAPSDYEPPRDECRIDDIIRDLHCKQNLLSCYIEENLEDLSPANLARLLSIHAQSCSRLGRLLRDRDILTGGWTAEKDDLVRRALAELGEEWGVDLLEPAQ